MDPFIALLLVTLAISVPVSLVIERISRTPHNVRSARVRLQVNPAGLKSDGTKN